MIASRGIIYLAGVALWSLCCVLFPIWVGRHAVYGVPTEQVRAPIWSPPPEAGMYNAVRWPWQRPSHTHDYHDFAVMRNCFSWTLGLFLLGLIYRGVSWIRPLKNPDIILSIGWSVSLSLVLAWLCIFPTLFPFIIPKATLTVALLTIAIIAGPIVGVGTHWYMRFNLTTKPVGAALTIEQTVPGVRCATTIDPAETSPRRHLYKIVCFTLVLPIAMAVTIAASLIASVFVNNQSYYGSTTAAGVIGHRIGLAFISLAPGVAYHVGARLDNTPQSIKGFAIVYFVAGCIAPLVVIALYWSRGLG
jgi:hypothetical protein